MDGSAALWGYVAARCKASLARPGGLGLQKCGQFADQFIAIREIHAFTPTQPAPQTL
jgi:hypothetical protein